MCQGLHRPCAGDCSYRSSQECQADKNSKAWTTLGKKTGIKSIIYKIIRITFYDDKNKTSHTMFWGNS